jgi:hypothetical protein
LTVQVVATLDERGHGVASCDFFFGGWNAGEGLLGAAGAFVTPGELDTPLTFDYFQRTPALSSALNWLYTNHPDAYLFGSLCEANAFNKGQAFQDASLWKTRRDEIFQEIFMLDFNERQGMAIRIMGNTP